MVLSSIGGYRRRCLPCWGFSHLLDWRSGGFDGLSIGCLPRCFLTLGVRKFGDALVERVFNRPLNLYVDTMVRG